MPATLRLMILLLKSESVIEEHLADRVWVILACRNGTLINDLGIIRGVTCFSCCSS